MPRPDLFRRAAHYVAKILNGAKPAQLAIEQPTKFDLVVNLKTASVLGLTSPREFLLIADAAARQCLLVADSVAKGR